MKNSVLHLALRNYLIINKVPSLFINFKKSFIRESDRYGEMRDFQILVLKKPNDIAFEIEHLQWLYPAETVLLVLDISSGEITLIPLKFKFKLPNMATESEFDFCRFESLKTKENHFLITAYGKFENGDRSIDIALFSVDGKLISVWQTCDAGSRGCHINDFHQLESSHWIANIEVNVSSLNNTSLYRMVHGLHLLTLSCAKTNTLSLKREFMSEVGTLLASKANEISSWFSDEIDGVSHFFVIASHYQCCVYRYNRNFYYDKIADIVLNNSFIDNVDDVVLSESGITVNFNNGRTLVESGSFHFSFNQEKS